jgi:hypothetical protein
MPGACSGCEYENASCKKVAAHATQCSGYARLVKEDPELALTPEAEYTKRRAEQQDPELRAAAREVRLNKVFADVDRRRQFETDRFKKPRDILADDEDEDLVT